MSSEGAASAKQGRLLLVDLAGSESLKRVQQAKAEADRQAVGIVRILTSLGPVGNDTSSSQDSTLATLLRENVSGAAKALLIANIGPEADASEETQRTLKFAAQMIHRGIVASVKSIDQEKSALMQMRERHMDCIRMLQEKAQDKQGEELEERRKLQQEMEDINTKLLTKESATETFEEIRTEQSKKIEEMRDEVAGTMKAELEKLQMQSKEDLESLKRSFAEESARKSRSDEFEKHAAGIRSEIDVMSKKHQASAEMAGQLRESLTLAEERAKMLQQRLDESRQERTGMEEERRGLQRQGEEQWQNLAAVEGQLHRQKAEVEVQKSEVSRLTAACGADRDAVRKEGEALRAREADLKREVEQLKKQLQDKSVEDEAKVKHLEDERLQQANALQAKVKQLEAEAAQHASQALAAERARAALEAEKQAILKRREELHLASEEELRHSQEALEEAQKREQELMAMLVEVQSSIMNASGSA